MQKEYYNRYAILEKEHWWFTARLNILKKFVDQIAKRAKIARPSILNIGVATGQTSIMLEQFGDVTSVEYDEDCCTYLREIAKIDVVQASATNLPFNNNAFDIVCAFDVIEHIEDHEKALDEISRVLKQNGNVLITVPAYMFLWSNHDVINQHFRRYTKDTLNTLANTRFQHRYSSYFNFFLFPLVALVRVIGRLLKKKKSNDHNIKSDFDEYRTNKLFKNILFFIFNSEKRFLGNITFPFGVSIIYNGVKKAS